MTTTSWIAIEEEITEASYEVHTEDVAFTTTRVMTYTVLNGTRVNYTCEFKGAPCQNFAIGYPVCECSEPQV